jgi:hypothetical protein
MSARCLAGVQRTAPQIIVANSDDYSLRVGDSMVRWRGGYPELLRLNLASVGLGNFDAEF